VRLSARSKSTLGPLLLLAAGCAAGCARVDPKPDYLRVGQAVGERTGFTDVYDPEAEALVADRVAELLQQPLTVDDAVRIALLNNPAFQAQFAILGASRADLVQSTLWTNPSLSFAAAFPDGGGRSRITAGLAQQIADLWQIPVRRKIAAAELERTLLATSHQGLGLVADVRVRCYRLLAAQSDEATIRETRAVAAHAAELAQAQLAAGEVGLLDVNLAKAALLDVDLEVATLDRERRTATAELGGVLGLARQPQTWSLADELPAPPADLPDDAELIATALAQRFDARAAFLAVTAAEGELVHQYLRVFPDLSLGVDLERVEDRALPGRKILADTVRSSIAAGTLAAPSIQSRGERRIDKSQIINAVIGPGLTITLPIWDQNQAQIAKAALAVQQRRKEVESLLDQIAAEVQQAAATARNLQQQIQVYEREALPQAEQNVTTSQHLYEQGEQSILAVLTAQQLLLQRRRTYIEVRRDYAVALAMLEEALASRLPTPAAPTTNPALLEKEP
jgi:cobalt-zinc-cadmium efflux system outer membrane protein